MLNIEAKTKLSRDVAMSRVKGFFEGLGLILVSENGGCLSFEGGGGYVTATLSEESNKTKIELVTQEWEFQVREFVANLG